MNLNHMKSNSLNTRAEKSRWTKAGRPSWLRGFADSCDGQTKLIREGDNGVAYSWNSWDHQWEKEAEAKLPPAQSSLTFSEDKSPMVYS
ncbi:hypothetical protein IHE45_10G026200 [Dioscorea alata]|uniref:Uncharacterized protein n=1 Tax=Dioscorea alata TaxID=55571 RepID=A0ACB7V9Y9_DIOAL|nr:hypothetical protein IHE45_10G026200 [Dioscorea alata]